MMDFPLGQKARYYPKPKEAGHGSQEYLLAFVCGKGPNGTLNLSVMSDTGFSYNAVSVPALSSPPNGPVNGPCCCPWDEAPLAMEPSKLQAPEPPAEPPAEPQAEPPAAAETEKTQD